MGSKGMTIEQFAKEFSPMVRNMAWRVMRNYSGWFRDPDEERKDLYAAGMLELVSIFDGVDFENRGYRSYVAQRVRGCLLNYIYRNIPPSHIKPDDGDDDPTERGEGRPRQFARSVPIDAILETLHESDDDSEIELHLFRHQILRLIGEFMGSLSGKERFMLMAYYQHERTYEQIGAFFQMRRETVSKKIKELLMKFKRLLLRRCSWRVHLEAIADYFKETDLNLVIVSDEEGPAVATVKEKQQ
jgi:RNA polymerase sigma factor (sigma-70 family)